MRPTHTLFCLFLFADIKEVNNLRSFERSELERKDIFQANAFQVAKFMFYYHNQLLPSMFLNLFVTSGQVHNYGTRTVNSYRSHPFRTNLKQFTILYQGPKIWSSLPATITCSQSLPSFKKKILDRVFNKIRFGLKPLTRSTNIYRFIFIRGGLYHKPGGFLRYSRQVDCINL